MRCRAASGRDQAEAARRTASGRWKTVLLDGVVGVARTFPPPNAPGFAETLLRLANLRGARKTVVRLSGCARRRPRVARGPDVIRTAPRPSAHALIATDVASCSLSPDGNVDLSIIPKDSMDPYLMAW